MKKITEFVWIVILIFICNSLGTYGQKECRIKGKNGVVDLRRLRSATEYGTKHKQLNTEIMVNICGFAASPCDGTEYKAVEFHRQQPCLSLGSKDYDDIQVSFESEDPKNPVTKMVYSDGGNQGSVKFGSEFYIRCDHDAKSTTVEFREEKKISDTVTHYVFDVSSKDACYTSIQSCPLGCIYGIGGLLMTLFFVFVSLYIIIGVIINLVRRKRSISEILPHFSIWKEIIICIYFGIRWLPDIVVNKMNNRRSTQGLHGLEDY